MPCNEFLQPHNTSPRSATAQACVSNNICIDFELQRKSLLLLSVLQRPPKGTLNYGEHHASMSLRTGWVGQVAQALDLSQGLLVQGRIVDKNADRLQSMGLELERGQVNNLPTAQQACVNSHMILQQLLSCDQMH